MQASSGHVCSFVDISPRAEIILGLRQVCVIIPEFFYSRTHGVMKTKNYIRSNNYRSVLCPQFRSKCRPRTLQRKTSKAKKSPVFACLTGLVCTSKTTVACYFC